MWEPNKYLLTPERSLTVRHLLWEQDQVGAAPTVPTILYENMSYYPEEGKLPFYVEFERGGHKNEFTLFRRQFIHSDEQMELFEKETLNIFPLVKMCNEGHPWNLFTSDHGPDGCVPDRKWICWMVDALNEKAERSA